MQNAPETIHSFGDALFFDADFLVSFPFLLSLSLFLQFTPRLFGNIIFLSIVTIGRVDKGKEMTINWICCTNANTNRQLTCPHPVHKSIRLSIDPCLC